MRPRLHILTRNHFDLTWRRCWDRPLVWHGKTYASYTDIERWYIEENLALAAAHPEYKFEVESVAVLRQFLRRTPHRRGEIAALVAERRFSVPGSGDNIVDAVLVRGESLVRNFTSGLDWLERELGIRPVMATRYDAFGNPAQLPQILRGCGLRWVTGCLYSPPHGLFWRGLDGSTVCVADLPTVGHGGSAAKHPPCPACRGTGCPDCAGRGIDPAKGRAPLPSSIDEEVLNQYGIGAVRFAAEEDLPNPAVIGWARDLRDRFDARFALAEEAHVLLLPQIERADDAPPGELHPGVELGFNNSGCWVTRIGLKQALRRNEAALREAETWAALATAAGRPWPGEEHGLLWEQLLFTMFHDAVTGTHVDAAADELRDINAALEAGCEAMTAAALAQRHLGADAEWTVVNPLGRPVTALVETDLPGAGMFADGEGGSMPVVPGDEPGRVRVLARDVPALGAATWRWQPGGSSPPRALTEPVIRNGRFEVAADEAGIIAIRDLALRRDICRRRGLSPGEFVIESDIGSPWATLEPPGESLPLGRWTRLVATEAGSGWQRLRFAMEGWPDRFKGHNGGAGGLQIASEVLLVDGLDRVEFRTTVDWDTHNMRLRMAFPTQARFGSSWAATPGVGWYGVPYGMLPRSPYEPSYGWSTANGDHPAVEWAGVQGEEFSVAVFDTGTPSYRIRDGIIEVSLLRAPTVPTFLHEPVFYSMTGFDGMRDAGRHIFRHALAAYDAPFSRSRVAHDAEAFNHPFEARAGRIEPWPAPRVEGDGVRLGAVTWLDERLMLRLAECGGLSREAKIHLPSGFSRAERTDLRGKGRAPLDVCRGQVCVPLRPWEIATVLLDAGGRSELASADKEGQG